MYKLKKIILQLTMITYIIIFLIELFIYMKTDANLFGLVYNIINTIMIFLLVPLTYNYKKTYSKTRISKLILVIIFGIFNSYILSKILINNMTYIDSSLKYENSISFIKNELKGIIYTSLIIFTIFESKLNKKIILLLKKRDD